MLQTETGALRKMRADLAADGTVNYRMVLGEQEVELNPLIGKHLTLNFSGHIDCQHCGRKVKKSYAQGYCFPCMQKLAQCDMCIMKPETCHFEQGTCREPEWGKSNCMIPHYVYLANTSGLKVGITRHTQIPTRWIDQGATQALPIFKVSTRLQSGLVEVIAEELKPKIAEKLASVSLKYGADAVTELDEDVVNLHFPVKQYLTKISSFNFDKTPEVSGVLLGIKGQYLIFETGVINLRKFTSYHVSLQVS
jgi:hypothetical protein